MTDRTPRPEDHIPLKAVVFHVLLALAERDLHGYGVIKAVRERSDDRIQLETGAFYRHLKKLLAQGLVEEADERPHDVDARRGAYYRLTSFGRNVLAAESARLSQLVDTTRDLGILPEGRV